MFRAANPYDDLVAKATDENLTSENWDLNLQICDRVSSQREPGARQVVDALTRRLAHRSANVQLFSLSLADTLGKNVPSAIIYPELSSRAFCTQLLRMAHDRATVHDVVRKRLLGLIQSWAHDMGSSAQSAAGNGAGAIMQETYDQLKAEHYQFTEKKEPPPKTAAEKEEEELQRVLALSLHDQGGRSAQWDSTPPANQGQPRQGSAYAPSASAPAPPAAAGAAPPPVSRVRALYDFTPGEQGELGFRAGDVLRVLNTVYEHWWKAELRGEIGIVPVNHLEVLPSPTAEEVARDAQVEAQVFAAESTVDALVEKLGALEARVRAGQPVGSLADDDELQALYTKALGVSPHVAQLSTTYQSRVDDLRALNSHFVNARGRFDQIVAPPSLGTQAAPAQPQVQPQIQPQTQPQTQTQTQAHTQQAAQATPSAPGAGAGAGAPYDIPQPPPGLDPSTPEYARWYYSVFPQAQPQAAQ